MNKAELSKALDRVEALASGSRFSRLVAQPRRYVEAIAYREFVYPLKQKSLERQVITYFGTNMHLLLPSSTDIYLTSGKSHDSEIRLARYLTENLEVGDHFIDVGAHYGYYTLLSSLLVGTQGKVLAIEPTPETYAILTKNCIDKTNVSLLQCIVSDTLDTTSFYAFSNQYAEYNTQDVSSYKSEKWFQNQKPEVLSIRSITLDQQLSQSDLHPKIIKIDVEGAEAKVIKGAINYLTNNNPIIVMEYMADDHLNTEHQKAAGLLNDIGYKAYRITKDGSTQAMDNISLYMQSLGLRSDNLVFIKER